MKKAMILLAAWALCAAVSWPGAMAEGANPRRYRSGTYTYVVLDDGTAEIVDYSGKERVVSVPGTLDGRTVARIGEGAFEYCAGLTRVTLPDSVTGIGDRAFGHCEALTHVGLPDGLTSIGAYAFLDCEALRSVSLPDSVIRIGSYAFLDCDALTSVRLPHSLAAVGANPMADCSRLTRVEVAPDHPAFATIGGVLFDRQAKSLLCFPCGSPAAAYGVPDGTTAIGDGAFCGCEALTAVTLPDSLTAIGDGAFSECEALTAITLPGGVTRIGDAAFSDCEALTAVTLPDGLTSIGAAAFSDCDALTAVTLPDSVLHIGEGAFLRASDQLVLTVGRDSYARQYAVDHGIRHVCPDAPDERRQ